MDRHGLMGTAEGFTSFPGLGLITIANHICLDCPRVGGCSSTNAPLNSQTRQIAAAGHSHPELGDSGELALTFQQLEGPYFP